MGQSQSSGTSSTPGSSEEVKVSYYILLGVERSATEDELKKAYRKKALELHPDRNFGNEEAATKTFAEIQAAYEILSDPQERAWYDSHESAILRGNDEDGPSYQDVRVTTADDLARLVRKFNSTVDFSDAPSGFFGFVKETFERLGKEEEIAADWEGVDVLEYPTFGHKADTDNDVVKRFYAAWSGFATVKAFSWCDKYRLSEAPDRWYRRRMEQENLRLRKDGKQEFNEAVRALVAFIKKRDPRFIPDTRTEAERQKALRDAAAAQAARARAANAAKLAEESVPEWTKFREPEELEESEEEEVEEEVLECVACNKVFKSEKQWEAHEKSKKHQKAIKTLQHKMRKQNQQLNLDGDDAATPDAGSDDEQEVDDSVAEEPEDHTGQADRSHEDALDHAHVHDDSDNAECGKEEAANEDSSDGPDEDMKDETTPSKNQADSEVDEGSAEPITEASNSEDEDYASMETIQARMQSSRLDTSQPENPQENDLESAKPKIGKAAQKRAKKAAAVAAGNQRDAGNRCQVCDEEFPSKTKLFHHIEKEGHAALRHVFSSAGAKSKKGKGKK